MPHTHFKANLFYGGAIGLEVSVSLYWAAGSGFFTPTPVIT